MKKHLLWLFTLLIAFTACLVSCEEEHICEYHCASTQEQFLKSEATCTQSASYWFSCTCGARGGTSFENGTYAPHTYDQRLELPAYLSASDENEYFYACICGARGTETFVGGAQNEPTTEAGTPEVVDITDYDITNYALLIKRIYQDCIVSETTHEVVADPNKKRNTTAPVMFDKTKPMYFGTVGTCEAHFYDKDMKWLEKKEGYFRFPISANAYHEDAVYVSFVYYRGNFLGDAFYVSTVNNDFVRNLYSTILKKKGTRPRIDILTTDTEEEIFIKLVNAWYTEDCDVYWEYGNYSFDSIYELTKTKYGFNTAYELPIGGNCRYYFNGSTLYATSTSDDANVNGNASLLGSNRRTGSYELFDGNLIAENIVYVVHDEASASPVPYVRKYHNMKMTYICGDKTSYIGKCIGGGTGLYGEVVIENSQFSFEGTSPNISFYQEVSYHGISGDKESNFQLSVYGCYFQHSLGLHNLGANQTAELVFANNSCTALPSNGAWTVLAYANEKRE